MAATTKIQWCDHSWSPWHGCARVRTGCENCYAEAMARRNPKTLGEWGPNGTRVLCANWDTPRKWNRQAENAGKRMSVFPSICDPFEDWTGTEADGVTPRCILDHNGNRLATRCGKETAVQWPDEAGWRPLCMGDVRDRFFRLIDETPWLDWMLLTKRPQNVRDMWAGVSYAATTPDINYTTTKWVNEPFPFRKNVFLLTSVSDQQTADAMIPELLKCRELCSVLGVSAEPLLGPIDFTEIRHTVAPGFFGDCLTWHHRGKCHKDEGIAYTAIDWVIVGGESGHHARPCNVDWVRSIVEQCQAARVPVFVKQLGAVVHASDGIDPLDQFPGEWHKFRQGPDADTIEINLRDPKGGEWDEWPPDLRVREYPKVVIA
jgi:protein gp37